MNTTAVITAALFGLASSVAVFAVRQDPPAAMVPAAVYASTATTPTPALTYWTPENTRQEAAGSDETAPPAVTVPPSCEDYVGLAWALGWPKAELGTLADVMHAESRCQADAIGDVARGGSFGLMQVHVPTWCQGSKYWPGGWLAAHGSVGPHECEKLLDPATNLAAALLIQREGGWQQWTTWRP